MTNDAPRALDDRQRDEDSRLMEILRRTLTDAEDALHREGIYTNPLAGLLDSIERRAEDRIRTRFVLTAARDALLHNTLDPLRPYQDDIHHLLGQ